MKTIISADRTCDLPTDLFETLDIQTVPYHIHLDGEDYIDNVTIELPTIFNAWKDHKSLPKTSAANIAEYLEHFQRLIDDAGEECEIVHITLGSSLSSSYQNACIAAQQLGNVYPVDSCTLSSATGLQVIDAARMASEGQSAKAIADYLTENVHRYHASFVIDTLEYLHAGGRCSTLAALASAALNIKPSVFVDTHNAAAMTVSKKYRGKMEKCVASYVRDKLAQYDDIDYSKVFITYSTPEDADIIKKIIEEETQFETVYISNCSCTIGSHCGPRCIGILFETLSNH